MPLDPKLLEKVFANHFYNLSSAEFTASLYKACPYLVEGDSSQININNHQINPLKPENEFDIYNVFQSLSALMGCDEFIFAECIASYDEDIRELEKLCRRYINLYENATYYRKILGEGIDTTRYTLLEKKIEGQEALIKSLEDRIYFQEQSMIGVRKYFNELSQVEHLNPIQIKNNG